MIVQGRHVDSVVEEGGHHGIYLILKQHQVAHHHFVAIRCLCERNPSAEPERSWCRYPLHGHLEIVAGNIDLQYPVLEIPFADGVLKVNIPRNDLKMTVQGISTFSTPSLKSPLRSRDFRTSW